MKRFWLCALLWAALPLQAAIELIDDDGRRLQLAAPAQRIVSLAPHLTELLFAAGAGARIVGTVAYSDFPAAAKAIPRIGDSAMLDLERVVALRPDLIVVWRNGTSAQQLARLTALGVPVFASESRRMAHIATTLRQFGQLAGTPALGEARAVALEREVEALRTMYAGRRELRVFYQIWHRPLLTVNGSHLISEALQLCGARNLFAGLKPLTPTVSEEAVLEADPDAIVTGSADPQGGEGFALWRRLHSLPATRSGALLVVDPDTLHRQSDRIVQGARELCEKLDGVRRRLPR